MATELEHVGGFAPIQEVPAMILDSLSGRISVSHTVSIQASTGAVRAGSGAQSLSQGASEQAASITHLNQKLDDMTRRFSEPAQVLSGMVRRFRLRKDAKGGPAAEWPPY